MGFHSGVARLGTLFAVLVGGLLTDQLGFRATALAFASITLAAGFLMLRERPPSAGAIRQDGLAVTSTHSGHPFRLERV